MNFVPAAEYRSFLLVFPAMATGGLLLWGVASFRLKSRFWRYSLAILSGLSAAGIGVILVSAIAQGDVGRPWAVPLAFMPAVLLGMVCWILGSKRTSFRWGRVIVYLVALLLAGAPAAAFMLNAYSLEAGLNHLGLALVPFGLVVLGFLIGSGAGKLAVVNLAVFAVVGGAHLYWFVRGIGRLGKAFSLVSGTDVFILGLIAAVSLVLLLVNWKAFRAGMRSG